MKKIILAASVALALMIGAYLLVSIPVDSTLSDEVVSRWEGISEVTTDLVVIQLNIKQDGSVSGMIGDAVFENGVIRKNRNNLGKFIGINSDYIIVGGIIRGKINVHDELELRTVSIPLNYEENLLKGSINLKEFFKYPDPVFPRIQLSKVGVRLDF